MRILAIDIGTGTQDILLFDSSRNLENCVKMVMPSATAIVGQRIDAATKRGVAVLLTGATMGGGPSSWAVDRHIKAGFKVYATPDAARTLNDDLEEVARYGVTVLSEDEAARLPESVERIQLRDLDLAAVRKALEAFEVDSRFDGVAIATLDHGAAPPGVSDRTFRFDHMRRVVEGRNELEAFVYLPHELPNYLTRMKAVAQCMDIYAPLVLLDTGPAAAMGALEDGQVAQREECLIANLGNMHTLAFHLKGRSIQGLFEHHTGHLSTESLDGMISRLAAGTLTNEEIFGDHGHGCYIINTNGVVPLPLLAVTGPRRGLLASSTLKPYFAAPHGDMMLSGCFGLVRGCAAKMPEWKEEIEKALSQV